MRKSYALCAALAAATVLALVGCGGDGPEAAIEAAVRTAALSDDPAKCTEVLTAAVREQTSGEQGAEALAECEEDAVDDEHDAKAVTVSGVEIDGSRATAEAAYAGGTFDGQTVLFALVDADGAWKIDEVVRITEFDRERLLAGAAVSLADEEETSPDQRRCIVAKLGQETQEEIEAVLLNRDEAAQIDLLRVCPGGDYDQPARAQVSHAIETLILGDEPSACVEFATQAYLETASGEHGNEALAACVLQQEEAKPPDSQEISNIRLDGSGATAKVSIRSEDQGDTVLILGLVTEGGHWKVDGVVRLVSIDRLAFAKGVLEGFTEAGGRVNPAVSACVLAKVHRIPLAQLEDLIYPIDEEASIELFGPCAEAATDAPPQT